MTKNEIMSTILAMPGAQMCRANKTNFIAVPTEDGVVKVSIGTALATDTKNHKAFNFDAAVAEYKAHEAEVALKAAERANRPVKVKGPILRLRPVGMSWTLLSAICLPSLTAPLPTS